MPAKQRTYIAIDLKSFYASVECVERGLNPLDIHLVVADKSRTEKTICLAVTPSLKAYGLSGRSRLFEVVQRVRKVNEERRWKAPRYRLTGRSVSAAELATHPELEMDYLVAPPRMAYYINYSTRVYQVYLRYVAPEDIHVYSIDEVFMDVTAYLDTYRMTPRQLASTIIRDVMQTTGITATAGIGTNLYLSKVAMDVVAKHIQPGPDGVRVAELDEDTYRRLLWTHRPLTDFWRVGRGIQQRLEPYGIRTMGDIARMSVRNENFLYRLFGVNAELLIDHAWGWEPCTIAQVKAYRPMVNSLSSGQVLTCAYTVRKARVVAREMAETLALDLLDKRLVTDQITLTIGYDVESLVRPEIAEHYQGEIVADRYGRSVPKHAHGSEALERQTCSARLITEATDRLFDRIVNADLLVRRLTLVANHVVDERLAGLHHAPVQLDLFTDYDVLARERRIENERLERERRLMQTTLAVKKKFGKNALLKGLNFDEGATARERNAQIGGHKA
ncbi:MAG: DNA methylase [Clostridium sp.]|nr:DNA methylase [Clostridium sp.]